MRQELQEELFAIEPAFFNRGDVRASAMAFGFECGDGWFNIIKPLIQMAKWKKDNPRRVKVEDDDGKVIFRVPFECVPDTREGWLEHPDRVSRNTVESVKCPFTSDPWFRRNFYCDGGVARDKETEAPIGECPGCEGTNFHVYYQHACERPWEHFQIRQVKEKFGTLRFYSDGHDAEFSGAVLLAEMMSSSICEWCGAWGATTGGKFWLRTLCPAHRAEQDEKDVEREAENKRFREKEQANG